MDDDAYQALIARLDKTCQMVEAQQATLEKEIKLLQDERKQLVDERAACRAERKALKKLYKRVKAAEATQASVAAATPAAPVPSSSSTSSSSTTTTTTPIQATVPVVKTPSATPGWGGFGTTPGAPPSASPSAHPSFASLPAGSPAGAWYFQDDDGKWLPYSDSDSATVEAAFQRGTSELTISNYRVSLANRTQTRSGTGKVRPILRGTWYFVAASSSSRVPFPEAVALQLETAHRSGSFPVVVTTPHGRVNMSSTTNMQLLPGGQTVVRGTAPAGAASAPSVASTSGGSSSAKSSEEASICTVAVTMPDGSTTTIVVDKSEFCHATMPLMAVLRQKIIKKGSLSCQAYELKVSPWLDWPDISPDSSSAVTASIRTRTDTFSVTVKSLTGKVIKITICSDDDVVAVKQVIEASEGIPVDQQRLIFGGFQLVDDKFVKDYSIDRTSQLHLVLRLRGD